MVKPLPLSFYLRVRTPRMFVMRASAPSVNRLIMVDPGCSPVGNGVPWCWVPERLWEFAPSAEAGWGQLPRSPTENKSCDYGAGG